MITSFSLRGQSELPWGEREKRDAIALRAVSDPTDGRYPLDLPASNTRFKARFTASGGFKLPKTVGSPGKLWTYKTDEFYTWREFKQIVNCQMDYNLKKGLIKRFFILHDMMFE